MSAAAFHVPDPADELAQRIAATELLSAELRAVHDRAERRAARYTPDADNTPAAESPDITDPDPEC